jgi:peptidoglycan/LPS O-acetylase OafA/YrhL
MYVLLPLLFVLTVRHRKAFRWMAWPAAVAVAVLLPRVPHLRALGPVLRFAPLFIPGVIAFNLSKELRPRLAAWLWPLLIAATAVVFMAFETWEVSWMVCLLLGCLLPMFHEQANAAVNRLTQTIAKYSYGIYLSHLLTIWLAFAYLAYAPLWVRVAAFIILSALLPYALYHLVERPGIELGKRVAAHVVGSSMKHQAAMKGPWASSPSLLCEESATPVSSD